jgi:coenzyme F420 hydrogenase subunit beta
MKSKTIESVINTGLCTGCGTCIALCPENALELSYNEKKYIYTPKINKEKCINCGICDRTCPGNKIDFNQLNYEIFGKKPDNIFIGNYMNCYIGYSTDSSIRYASSSGGLVTQLLVFALEEGIIDGALVTRMKKERPLEPEPFIAKTREEIIEASKSKYCPVPANTGLKKILESKNGEKFAVVGLPCHIQGVRKAEQIDKTLRDKIVLHIGLFCNHTPNFLGTELYLKKVNVKKDEVIKLDYRGDGWPGFMSVYQKDGSTKNFTNYWSFASSYLFYPERCLMCNDGICELADISFGDAWLPEFQDDKIGTSIIVSKNEIGEKIIQEMVSKNKINLSSIHVKKVMKSQSEMIYFKKKNIKARRKLFGFTSEYNNTLESDFVDYLLALYPYLNYYASNSNLKKILFYMPFRIIQLCNIFYRKLLLKKAEFLLK